MIPAYYVLATTIATLASPLLLFKKKARAGVLQKLGFVPAGACYLGGPVWFHTVSVGEFNATWPLIQEFHKTYPQIPIVVSTTTATGQQLAVSRASAFAEVVYFPYDLPWSPSNWLDKVCPRLVAIAETEIWPGFISECQKRMIPVVMVNGRMSPRSFKSYYRWRWFFGPLLKSLSAIGVQSQSESDRFKDVMGDNRNIHVLGNLKLDGQKSLSESRRQEIANITGISAENMVIVAGSTHEGEEAAVLEAYKGIIAANDNARLIIAPRHPERFQRASEVIRGSGLRPKTFSANERLEGSHDVYLLDAIGHLADFYSVATLAFVGGTLAPIGGHNLAEPYAFGAPVVCGPRVEKTKDVANALLERDAICMVKDADELKSKMLELASNAQLRSTMGDRGKQWLVDNQGAIARTMEMIGKFIGKAGNGISSELANTSGSR